MTVVDGMSDERAHGMAQQLANNELFRWLVEKMLEEQLTIIDNSSTEDAAARESAYHRRRAYTDLRTRVDVIVSKTGLHG